MDVRPKLRQTLIEPNEIFINLGETIEANLGEVVNITAQTNANLDTILWSPIDFLDTTDRIDASLIALETFTLNAQVIDLNGCTAMDEVLISVSRDVDIYVPNIFSPNDDGVNDVFFIFAGPQVKIIKEFAVFERWGSQLLNYSDIPPNDPTYGWNGEHRGKLLNPNVFLWMAEIEYIDGSTEIIKGDVTLIR